MGANPLGIKTMYYTHGPEGIWFASEVRASGKERRSGILASRGTAYLLLGASANSHDVEGVFQVAAGGIECDLCARTKEEKSCERLRGGTLAESGGTGSEKSARLSDGGLEQIRPL